MLRKIYEINNTTGSPKREEPIQTVQLKKKKNFQQTSPENTTADAFQNQLTPNMNPIKELDYWEVLLLFHNRL